MSMIFCECNLADCRRMIEIDDKEYLERHKGVDYSFRAPECTDISGDLIEDRGTYRIFRETNPKGKPPSIVFRPPVWG